MNRNSDFEFVSTDAKELERILIDAFERICKTTVLPASPEKLYIDWVLSVLIQERALTNFAGNQNIPSRASGKYLDALGELFFETTRPGAQSAVATERFYISEAQQTAILIPAGTRLTDTSNTLVWETMEDHYIGIGDTSVDIKIRCQTPGTIGNGYAMGQINTIVDVYDYYSRCENITVSDDGSDPANDEEYYNLMRASTAGYSCAGSEAAYEYFAKRASTEIADVVSTSPSAGNIVLYALMQDGKPASEEIKQAISAACSPGSVRPMADHVSVGDPEQVSYNIALTYYVPRASISPSAAQSAVTTAVNEFVSWQSGKLGRDINPSYLISKLMSTGIKRIELTAPAFKSLRDGSDNTVPQLATIGEISVINGGFEDE